MCCWIWQLPWRELLLARVGATVIHRQKFAAWLVLEFLLLLCDFIDEIN